MDPFTIGVGVAIVAAIAFGAAALTIKRMRRNTVMHWAFGRQRNVQLVKGESFAGLVAFEDGGYVERESAQVDMRTGRAMLESGPVEWRRARVPVYLVRAGDSAPLEFEADGALRVNNVSGDEYDARVDLASELAVADAARRANRGDFISIALGISVLILAIMTAVVAGAVVLR